MPLRYEDGTVYFDDHCVVDEALELVEFFNANPAARVDMSRCSTVHTALIQILPVASLSELVAPTEPSLRKMLLPFFRDAAIKLADCTSASEVSA